MHGIVGRYLEQGSETKTGGVLPMMRAAGVLRLRVWLLGAAVLLVWSCALKAQSFTVEQILSAPFPSQLTAAERERAWRGCSI